MSPHRRREVVVCVLGAACAGLLLAVGDLHASRRSALVGGLLPLKQSWSEAMDHESVHARVARPHHDGHLIFAPLDEPVMHSITSDIPNMVDTAMTPTNNYEDKLNRKLLRLQREKAALVVYKHGIIDGLVSDRDWQQQRVAANAVGSHSQRLWDALARARRQQWGMYEKASKSYANAKGRSTMRADEYLKRRGRVMSRIKHLVSDILTECYECYILAHRCVLISYTYSQDDLLSYGDGQTSSARDVWHKEWTPFDLAHAAPVSASSAQNEDLDELLKDIQGQAEAMGDDPAKAALLDKVKVLHDVISGGGDEERALTIPDKRSWRKMNSDLDTFSSHLNERDPLDTDAAWAWHQPRTSSEQWRRRDASSH